MKIVILGCGRVGARLAQLMEAEGHEVSVIDSDPASFARLGEEFMGRAIVGTGIDVDVLKSAGIENADAFAAVTNFDNTNIMACEVAKEIFGVEKVLARIYDPGREKLYHELGLETICPTTLISTTARDIMLAPEGAEILAFPPHNEPSQRNGAQQGAGTARAPMEATSTTAPAQQGPQATGQETDRPNGRGLRNLFKH